MDTKEGPSPPPAEPTAEDIRRQEIAERRERVGAGSLLQLYEAPITLWAFHCGAVEPDELDHVERVRAGRYSELAHIPWLRDDHPEWEIRKVRRLVRHKTVPLQGHPDVEVLAVKDREGPGIAELKNRDFLVHRDADERPTLGDMLQLQGYLACTGRAWGLVSIIVGGNKRVEFPFERHEPTIGKIERDVAQFWELVQRGDMPAPGPGDREIVARLKGKPTRQEMLALEPTPWRAKLAEYCALKQAMRDAAKRVDVLEAELIIALGDHVRASCEGFTVSAPLVEVPGREVPARFQKEYSFRRFTVRSPK